MRYGTFYALAVMSILSMCCFGAGTGEPAVVNKPGVGLTIYNDNFAVVREARNMKFEKGQNTVRFTDVASAIDPTSVKFTCLSSPGAVSVLEQNYEYDLVNTDSLLKRYIDKQVVVAIRGGGSDARKFVEGTLLAGVGGDLIVKSNASTGLEVIERASVEGISLKEMPDDLVTRPTLVWLTDAKKAGEQLCEVTYTTGAIGWKADYTAILNADDTALGFSGWVTIDNTSGAGYKDATLKLIAGDVRRIQPPMPMARATRGLAMEMAGKAPAFEEKSFMEYHMYTLGRKSTINNNQVKQIEFIEPAEGAKAKKIYVYERSDYWNPRGGDQNKKMMVKIEFENKKENKLGIALPKGKVRVFKKDPADNSLQFVGEDEIDHTPKDEKLSLYIGDAFDIVAEHTLVDNKEQLGKHRESHKIELRNRKNEEVTVLVDEKFARWVYWEVEKSTQEYEKKDAYTARFPVKVGANASVTLEYTVVWSTWKW
ncbi:MAG: hypothetical protein ABR913_00930 [Sedimentisphaerales bacterium]|jgi:hypothetical protein